MPPRFAYWTILIDNTPTAFRARDAQELQPTLAQLKRTNENVVLKWFSGGTLWDSPDAAREARRRPKVTEKRGADWRPGGEHRDPRARFDKKKKPRDNRRPAGAHASRPAGEKRPFKPSFKPSFKPFKGGAGARKPFGAKPGGDRQRFAKPWSKAPRKPFGAKPGGDRPRFAKPWQNRDRPQGNTPPREPDTRPAPPKRRWRGGRRDDEE